MTNKEIRRRAWELCRTHFRMILGASFLISLISSLMINIVYLLGDSPVSSLVTIGLAVLSAIMTLGMVRFILDIWHEQPTFLSVLFSQRHRFWTNVRCGLLLGLIVVGIAMVVTFPLVLSVAATESMTLPAILITVAASVLIIWIGLRFEMTTACVVLRPDLGARACMRTAWRASKGNVFRLFCNALILNLPLLAAQALLMGYQIFLSMRGQMLNGFGAIVLDIASMLISALLTGYIALGTYALHEQLLDAYAPVPPQNIELPASEESNENQF